MSGVERSSEKRFEFTNKRCATMSERAMERAKVCQYTGTPEQTKREQHVAVSTRCMTMATEAHVGMPIEYRPVLTGALLAPNTAALAEPQARPESAKGASGVGRRGE
jgi:hypothetical protein